MNKLLTIVLPLLAFATLPKPASAQADEVPPLRAYVWEHKDQWTGTEGIASAQLEAAGFEVLPLPTDKSPFELLDGQLIFIGSFVSEAPGYKQYMKKYAKDLYRFVDKGNLLIQMTQADQVEAQPQFLPTTQAAQRSDRDHPHAYVYSPDHPLVQGVQAANRRLQTDASRTIWEAFSEFGGFEVILAGDDQANHPAMMEGAYGQGRILLCAMAFDKGVANDREAGDEFANARKRFAKQFFSNLAGHVANIRDRKTEPLNITVSPKMENRFVEGSWTIAVLPDTQVYSLRTPGLFLAQTAWLLQKQEELDLRYVLHLGDIVNNNTHAEWKNAYRAMSLLNDKVPYAIAPGNHDYGPSGDASTRETHMNKYFEPEQAQQMPTFGGLMETGKLDNSYHLFEAGGKKWIVLCLEWGPRDSTLKWANQVMSEHKDRLGILVTHAYMNNNDLRYDHTDTAHPQHFNPHEYRTPGGVNDGEEIWQKLVRRHRFVITLNGHVLGDGTGYRADRTDKGNTCHQMLMNYQMRSMGGESYLRLLEFRPDGRTVRVKAYSPLFDRYITQGDHSFTIDLD